jgi:DNA-binding GntR family transcriptional regulator
MRRRVAAGEWASGQQLPAMAGLASHYQVSRGTVATVVRRVAGDGLAWTVRAW